MYEKDVKIAKCYYNILLNKVNLFNLEKKMTFEQFWTELEGHNFDGSLFDVNFGNITATIVYRDGVCQLCKNIEIYDENGNLIIENYEI